MTSARLTVCVGGGGVGKTTCSAALALHLARSGKRTLVVTVDPARRLADALGIAIGHETMPVTIDPTTGDRLHAKMPDPRVGMTDLLLNLFTDPAQRDRVRANPAFDELSDSLAGVHEMLTVGLVQGEVDSGRFDEVVLDTAPSRNALTFVDYPARLLGLLDAKALVWLSALGGSATPARGLLAWGRAKVEGIIGRVLGNHALKNLSALFGEMLSVREKWAADVRRSQEILADPRNRYFVFGVPTGGSIADVRFLAKELKQRQIVPEALVLNRAASGTDEAQRALADGLSADSPLRIALEALAVEHAARVRATENAEEALRSFAAAPILHLPLLPPGPPRSMVLAIAEGWSKLLR